MESFHDDRASEQTFLLQPKPKTPLPWTQISIIFLAVMAEPTSSAYIFPFINQLVGELGVTGGDDRKIGYYAGLIESLFFVTQALTSWQWSQMSDFIGRRPLVLLGLFGLSASNIAFGLSRTLSALIISRCIAGLLNGNVGVMKSMLGDVTDHTNMAQVFALAPSIFGIGSTIALFYGGLLVKPQERWPHLFGGEFWATYPYFLPSLVSGCFTFSVLLICAAFLKESLPSKMCKVTRSDAPSIENAMDTPSTAQDAQPISMSTLLRSSSVMIPIANNSTLALVEINLLILLPLFYASPLEIGGLGFSPPIIGTVLATLGIMNGLVQGLFTAKIMAWIGARRMFRCSVLSFYLLILLFPIMSVVVTTQGKVGPVVWILIVIQLIFMVLVDMSYTVVCIYVTRATPNRQSLGSTNGLSQSLMSTARAIGPALTTSLFAVSKEYNILGGNLVYVILMGLNTILVVLSRHLPDLKDEDEDEDEDL